MLAWIWGKRGAFSLLVGISTGQVPLENNIGASQNTRGIHTEGPKISSSNGYQSACYHNEASKLRTTEQLKYNLCFSVTMDK